MMITSEISVNIKNHSHLIGKVRELISDPVNDFAGYHGDDLHLPDRFGFRQSENSRKTISLVMAEDTAIELGSPSEKSASAFLWTKQTGIVQDGIWISGNDFVSMKSRSGSFAQIIMAELREDADPTDSHLHNCMYLTNRLSGYMTRSLPGRLWIRIHKNLIKEGFSLLNLGRCLVAAYREMFTCIASLGIVLVSDNPGLVSKFEEIQSMARIISGENRKLQWETDGTLSCDDLNCSSCDEQVYCDTMREIIVKREKRK